MYKKIKSEKEHLRYMKMLEDGYSMNYIHIHYGINKDLLKSLWTKYKDKGPLGLVKRCLIRHPCLIAVCTLARQGMYASYDLQKATIKRCLKGIHV